MVTLMAVAATSVVIVKVADAAAGIVVRDVAAGMSAEEHSLNSCWDSCSLSTTSAMVATNVAYAVTGYLAPPAGAL